MPERRFTNEEESEIVKIYLSGSSTRAIARAYNLPGKDAVLGALRRQNITQRSPAERNRLYKLNPNVFDIITPESAYWWGFIYADGNVNREKTLVVGLKASDRSVLEKLKIFLQSESPIRESMTTLSNGKSYPRVTISFTDRHLAARLIELGIVTHRTDTWKIPANLPKDCESHFIRGLFDGDGSIDFNSGQPRVRICGNKDLIEWLWKTMHENNAVNEIGITLIHKKSGLRYFIKNGRYVVLPIIDFLYRDATVFLERKHEKAMLVYVTPPERVRDEKGRYT